MTLNKFIDKSIETASSLKVMVVCLLLLMVLVFIGTLSQVQIGIFASQKKYFQSFFIFIPLIQAFQLPIFPGGLLVCIVLFINQLTALITRFSLSKKLIGLVISHTGLLVLLAGGGLTYIQSTESQLIIKEGETKNYSEDSRNIEFVIIDTSDPTYDTVVSIPERRLSKKGIIHHPNLPFQITVLEFFKNAELIMDPSVNQGFRHPHVDQGVGQRVGVIPRKELFSDDRQNIATAFIELRQNETVLGTYLVSLGLGAPQSVTVNGRSYLLAIRSKRYYNDYNITLKDFTRRVHVGTNVPSYYSSEIILDDPSRGEQRDILIYMNHPLRYKGKTFFQSSFGENETLSILQVVDNPSWLFPYVSCTLVALGLIFHFMMKLFRFTERQS